MGESHLKTRILYLRLHVKIQWRGDVEDKVHLKNIRKMLTNGLMKLFKKSKEITFAYIYICVCVCDFGKYLICIFKIKFRF